MLFVTVAALFAFSPAVCEFSFSTSSPTPSISDSSTVGVEAVPPHAGCPPCWVCVFKSSAVYVLSCNGSCVFSASSHFLCLCGYPYAQHGVLDLGFCVPTKGNTFVFPLSFRPVLPWSSAWVPGCMATIVWEQSLTFHVSPQSYLLMVTVIFLPYISKAASWCRGRLVGRRCGP